MDTAWNSTVAQPQFTVLGANGMQPAGNIQLPAQNVTAVHADMLAHTFTIQQLGVNIPVVGDDTETACLYLNQTGTFQ